MFCNGFLVVLAITVAYSRGRAIVLIESRFTFNLTFFFFPLDPDTVSDDIIVVYFSFFFFFFYVHQRCWAVSDKNVKNSTRGRICRSATGGARRLSLISAGDQTRCFRGDRRWPQATEETEERERKIIIKHKQKKIPCSGSRRRGRAINGLYYIMPGR